METRYLEKALIDGCLKNERPKMSPKEIHWDSLVNHLEQERLTPLFYHWLLSQTEWLSFVPNFFFALLKKSYYVTAAKNILQKKELLKVLDRFHQAHIPVILYKGIFLAEILYKNPGVRPMVDVDLLIKPAKYLQATACLKSLGFAQEKTETSFSNSLVSIDLHTDLTNTSRFQRAKGNLNLKIQKIWQQAMATEYEGIPVLILSLEDQLIALCHHLAFNHRLQGLLWFADLIRLLALYQEKLNWPRLVTLTKEYEMSKSVFYCLKYLQDKWEVSLPPGVLKDLEPEKSGFFERTLIQRIWEEKPLGKLSYFLSLNLIENKKLRRRYFWLTPLTLRWPQFL